MTSKEDGRIVEVECFPFDSDGLTGRRARGEKDSLALVHKEHC